MHIILNHSSMVPIYEQLMEQIKTGIIESGAGGGRGASFCEKTGRRASYQCSDGKKSL